MSARSFSSSRGPESARRLFRLRSEICRVVAVIARSGFGWGDRLLAWLSHGPRLWWAPAAALATAKLALMFVVPERQGLFTDWGGHAEYWPIFAFGFFAAGHPAIGAMLARVWRQALVGAAIAGAVVVAIEVGYPADEVPPHAIAALDRAARVAMAWWMVIALFHIAERWLNRDNKWRKPLAEAVFPAYLIHHPVIVITAWETVDLNLNPWLEFAILLGASGSACAGAYLIGRRVGWIGPLIGLRPRVARGAASARAALHEHIGLDAGDSRGGRSDRARPDIA